MSKRRNIGQFWNKGEPFVWASGAALAITLAMTAALLGVILFKGLGAFWTWPLAEVHLTDGSKLLGDVVTSQWSRPKHLDEDEIVTPPVPTREIKYRVANMEDQDSFRWVNESNIKEIAYPENAYLLDRVKGLQYIGYLERLETPTISPAPEGTPLERQLAAAIRAVADQRTEQVAEFEWEEQRAARELHRIVMPQLIRAKYDRRQLLKQGGTKDSEEYKALDQRVKELEAEALSLNTRAQQARDQYSGRVQKLRDNVAVFVDAAGRQKQIAIVDIVRFSRPNAMGLWQKIVHYGAKTWELVSQEQRESNQDGGVFPAIFGTVLMVFIMAIASFPLGVLAGIYLGEYAKEGPLVKLVRIAVNNLAGIPSIVYGIFGLGFFIYFIGGMLDNQFYPDRVAASQPVFGQSCILWASLTLGLLTVPVVIVSTEEALRSIPRGVSESSYALGATKFQTLWRVLVPMASPGMMTGFILAMARAAGEVAPLMLTGAVKIAPLPADSQFPYVHLDQQFMHLGYHILDISCKSPNIEATKPLVYVTTLLLLFIVLTMSSAAIFLRNRMRKRYQSRGI